MYHSQVEYSDPVGPAEEEGNFVVLHPLRLGAASLFWRDFFERG
jgi:hypothetical protein